jgi:hypothetical protein
LRFVKYLGVFINHEELEEHEEKILNLKKRKKEKTIN